MKKEYLIKKEDSGKYNIYYYENNVEVLIEFYAYNLLEPITEIRQGYTKHKDSL